MDNKTLIAGLVKMNELLLAIGDDGTKSNGLCFYKGMLSDVWNIFPTIFARKGFRCNIVHCDKLGTLNVSTGHYDGSIGLLRDRKIDIAAIPVYYPLNDPDEDFMYTAPLIGDTMTILSYYEVTDKMNEGDILSMFTSVPYTLWLGYIFPFLLFLLISMIGTRIWKINPSPFPTLWSISCSFLEQNNFSDGDFLSARILILTIVTSAFFTMNYAENCMGTDMVVPEVPVTVTSYDDIIDRNITLGLVEALPEYGAFRSAEIGSKEWKMFQNVKLINPDVGDYIGTITDQIFKQEIVTVVKYPAANMFATLLFDLAPERGRAFIGHDPDAKSYSLVMAYTSRYQNTIAGEVINKIFRMVSENGFVTFLAEQGPDTMGSFLGKEFRPSLKQKISSKIDVFEGNLVCFTYKHFHNVLNIVYAGLVLSIYCLAFEHLFQHMNTYGAVYKRGHVVVGKKRSKSGRKLRSAKLVVNQIVV